MNTSDNRPYQMVQRELGMFVLYEHQFAGEHAARWVLTPSKPPYLLRLNLSSGNFYEQSKTGLLNLYPFANFSSPNFPIPL